MRVHPEAWTTRSGRRPRGAAWAVLGIWVAGMLLSASTPAENPLSTRFEAARAPFHRTPAPSGRTLTLLMVELETLNEEALEQLEVESSSFFPSLYLAWGSCLVGLERAAREGEGSPSAAVALTETTLPLALAELRRFTTVLASEPKLREDEGVRGALLGVESCLASAVGRVWRSVGSSPAAVAGVQAAPFWSSLQSFVEQGVLALDVERLRRPAELLPPTPAPVVASYLAGSSAALKKVTGRLRVTLTLSPEAARALKLSELRARVVAPGVDSQEVTVPAKKVTRVGDNLMFYVELAQRESTVIQPGARVELVIALGDEEYGYTGVGVE